VTARKSLTIVAVGAIIAFAVGQLAINWVKEQVVSLTVPQVIDAARGSVEVGPERVKTQRVAGLTFPDLSKQDLELVGGNTATLPSGGTATTAVYRDGKLRLTYSIVTGTKKNVDNAVPDREVSLHTPRGKVQAQELNDVKGVSGSDYVALKYKRAGQIIILTASERDDAGRKIMRNVAKLDGDPVGGATTPASTPAASTP
jgi:hypothetical protein